MLAVCRVVSLKMRQIDQPNQPTRRLAGTNRKPKRIIKDVFFLYAFNGNKITFTDETGMETTHFFQLDTASNPKMILIQPVDNPTNSPPVSVAYELNGDSLTIVVAPPDLRPTVISDQNNQELIVCKRKS